VEVELNLIPLLAIQRELYDMPRGARRFQAYLRTLVDEDTGDLALPLVTMNPMGKDHVPALLDTLRQFGAEDVDGHFTVGLVVADDAHGGWTDRYCSECSHHFEGRALAKRGWIVAQLWTGDTPSPVLVREETATAIHRMAHIRRRGPATTLGKMLDQEGTAMAAAACSGPTIDAEDLTYTHEVIAPFRGATDRATVIACLFGDDAARTLGYRAHGLSPAPDWRSRSTMGGRGSATPESETAHDGTHRTQSAARKPDPHNAGSIPRSAHAHRLPVRPHLGARSAPNDPGLRPN